MKGSPLFCPSHFFRSSFLAGSSRQVTFFLFLLSFSLFCCPATVQGQISFLTPPTYTCATEAGILAEADFNRDGKPDLICQDGTLLLGNGDGTFTTGTAVGGSPLAVADFNGDGIPDILEQGTGTLLVLLGNGDGTFQAAISTPSGASLGALAARDLNGDGKADVVGVFNNTLLVYLSKGDGTFAAGVPYSLGSSSVNTVSVILADFTGDNKVDVAVMTDGDNVAGQVIVFPGNGDGTLQSSVVSAGVYANPAPGPIAVAGDFDGDGKLDLAVDISQICNGTCVGTNDIGILLGNGDGTFQAPSIALAGNGPIAAADFNGDGKQDLVLESGNVLEIALGKGDGTFPSIKSYELNPQGSGKGLAIADFNQDGKLDIAADSVVLLGNGDGTLQGWPAPVLPANPSAIATGDFDKSGTQDVAAILAIPSVNTYTYAVDILLSDSTGYPNLAHSYALQQQPQAIASADLNGDGNLDLVIAGNDPSTGDWGYSVLLGNGDGSFQSPVPYLQSVDTPAGQVIVADFNNDHKPDIAIALGNSNLAVLLGNGNGTFGPPSYYFANGTSDDTIIMSADFNGDGNADLVAVDNSSTTPTAFLYGNGDGTFQPAVFPLGTIAAALTADVNNDGKPDLLGDAGQVLLGNGDGTFTTVTSPWIIPPNYTGPGIGLVADFNGDGNLDVFGSVGVGTHDVFPGVFPGNGDGTFGTFVFLNLLETTGFSVQLGPFTAADVNGDGKPDLISSSPFFVMINTTPPVPTAKLSASSIAFPSTVTGSSSAMMSVTVTNTGAAALSVTGVSISGAQASQFSQTNNCTSVSPAASCTINAVFSPTVAGNAAASLTIADNAVSGTQTVALSGVATAPPGFSLGSGSGSPTSQTVSAGQSAKFSLAITPTGGFAGTVSLSCAVSPVMTAGPTCSLSSSTLQISGGTAAPVTASVGTTATTTGTISSGAFPLGALPMMWGAMLLGSGWLLLWNRKRLPSLAASLIVLALASGIGCGGGGPKTTTTTTTGTAAGTYTATVTATAGSVSQMTALTVIVQ
jgi:hypothetical protein